MIQQSNPLNSASTKRIAVIGSGIAGLSAAHHLAQAAAAEKLDFRITLFEADQRLGGHAHTVDVSAYGKTFPVDTGFLVFNHKTYPGLTPFFESLGVVTVPSDMGFSVQVKASTAPSQTMLEWAGNSLASVFSQRKNLVNPRFWRMLKDLLRFNKAATKFALNPPDHAQTLGEYLAANNYSHELRDWYLIPMAAAIWSCPTSTMMAYPMATFARFCHNHGLLQIANRPQWYTVAGGSKNYVHKVRDALLAMGCEIKLEAAVSRIERINDQAVVTISNTASPAAFDAVIVAAHSDQALRMLASPSANEQCILGAIRYQPNLAVLHTDASVLPSKDSAWAAWNYETHAAGVDATVATAATAPNEHQVCLHYLLNKLQPLPVDSSQPVLVSLNPLRPLDPSKVLQTFEYDHPVFDSAAIAAQQDLHSIQGQSGIWFAGAWSNYGFHEDGFQSGKQAAQQVLDSLRSA